MTGPMLHGMPKAANWNLDTAEGMANAVEWQRRQFALLRDQGRWLVPRSGSVIVVDQVNKRAICVLSMMGPETSIRRVVEAMGWTYIDKAAGEEIPS